MVIITGPAGCGKSTTLAAMLEYINKNFHYHIITIEDPIEFLLEGKKSLINQREIGKDTLSFHRALKSVVRESPDVIMIGEIRDRETFEAALNASETGSLVLTTLHTKGFTIFHQFIQIIDSSFLDIFSHCRSAQKNRVSGDSSLIAL